MFGLREKRSKIRRHLRKISRPSFAVPTVGTFVALFTFLSIARYSAWINLLAEQGNLGTLGLDEFYKMYPFAGCGVQIPEAAVFGLTVSALAAGLAVGKYMSTSVVKREQKVGAVLSAVFGGIGILMATIGQAYYDPSLDLTEEEYVGELFQILGVTPTVMLSSGVAFIILSAYVALRRI